MPARNCRLVEGPCPRHGLAPTPWVCRHPPGGTGNDRPDAATGQTTETVRAEDRVLCCAQCLVPVARERDRIAIAGAHRHVFANPHGLVFEIGCFARAPGCAGLGPTTPDFSWFPGTTWQVAICAHCGMHLGWRYAGHPDGPFYGLILPRLIQAPDNPVRD